MDLRQILCAHFTFSKNMNDRKLVESYIMYFFMQKIDKINQLIDMQNSSEMSKAGEKGYADSDTLSQEQGPDRVATRYIFSFKLKCFKAKRDFAFCDRPMQCY